MKYLILSFLFVSSAFAQQEYVFKHLDCKVRFSKTDDFLNELAHEKLSDKGYKTHDFVNTDKMNVGDLYFHLEYSRAGMKLWKDCIVNVAIKKAKNQKVFSKDKVLFKKSVKRSLPRHTFSGNERCKRALKDAFVHIPYCQRMTVNEKVQGN